MELKELELFLRERNVPLQEWGRGEAKTIKHLLSEINSEESRLENLDNSLVRIVDGSGINVYYRSESRIFLLREDRQVFVNGRVKRRNISTSIGEKMRPGECSAAAAWRALDEELGIKEKLPLIPRPDEIKGPVSTVSFPGLQTIYTIYIFDIWLPEHWYKPEGYIEIQKDKTNYYIWEEISKK